jgi:hypothetical protein
MSDYDHLADEAIPAHLMAGEEETPPEPPTQEWSPVLPPDIEAVWGVSPEGSEMASTLIERWGEEKFRASAVHRSALKENDRDGKMEVIRAAFIKAKKEKG